MPTFHPKKDLYKEYYSKNEFIAVLNNLGLKDNKAQDLLIDYANKIINYINVINMRISPCLDKKDLIKTKRKLLQILYKTLIKKSEIPCPVYSKGFLKQTRKSSDINKYECLFISQKGLTDLELATDKSSEFNTIIEELKKRKGKYINMSDLNSLFSAISEENKKILIKYFSCNGKIILKDNKGIYCNKKCKEIANRKYS